MNKMNGSIPFDQLNRQMQVSLIIEGLRKPGSKLKILDVGGYKGITAVFFPKDDVTVVDLYDVKEENYIKANGLDMPFKDNEFDFVLSFDVLEHIPEGDRKAFIIESHRVARTAVITCAPHNTKSNNIMESTLNDYYKKLHRRQHPWLKEHIINGLPDVKKTTKIFNELNMECCVAKSNDTLLWGLMQKAIFLNSKYDIGAPSLIEINRYYNVHMPTESGDTLESSYRFILVGFKDNLMLDKAKTIINDINDYRENRLNLIRKLFDYDRMLITKTNQEKENYKDMYNLEKNEKELIATDRNVLKENLDKRTVSKIIHTINTLKK